MRTTTFCDMNGLEIQVGDIIKTHYKECSAAFGDEFEVVCLREYYLEGRFLRPRRGVSHDCSGKYPTEEYYNIFEPSKTEIISQPTSSIEEPSLELYDDLI